MRFKFESGGREPIGEGEQKKTFVDPDNAEKVVATIKPDEEGEVSIMPRDMKGSYYLTKIAHMALPGNIPDIHQAGKMGDSASFVRERVAHDLAHQNLQQIKSNLTEEDRAKAREAVVKEIGGEISELTDKLADTGFAFDIDGDVSNFTRDGKGNVKYLEEFNPWEMGPDGPELKFGKEELEEAISNIPDENKRKMSERYMARLLKLFDEEKSEYQAKKAVLESFDYGPEIQELTKMLESYEAEHNLDALMAIGNVEEALASADRKSANMGRIPLVSKINELIAKPIPTEKYREIMARYKRIDAAIGTIRHGKLEHDRD